MIEEFGMWMLMAVVKINKTCLFHEVLIFSLSGWEVDIFELGMVTTYPIQGLILYVMNVVNKSLTIDHLMGRHRLREAFYTCVSIPNNRSCLPPHDKLLVLPANLVAFF
uniref:Uncharacterized protein n=1 Tax=Nelumbo nucifera TaxID=4432 RepID=A0A822YT72_NELNU|nr:TPA_asm: hypothetical protein HUJ06_005943 [Nelumbo nucifera]